jgi:gas vesicle protein
VILTYIIISVCKLQKIKEVFMRKAFNFMVGLMMGGVVGATIAMLFAPASGEDIRTQLQDRAMRLKDDVKAVAEARRAELERELAALRAPYTKG